MFTIGVGTLKYSFCCACSQEIVQSKVIHCMIKTYSNTLGFNVHMSTNKGTGMVLIDAGVANCSCIYYPAYAI